MLVFLDNETTKQSINVVDVISKYTRIKILFSPDPFMHFQENYYWLDRILRSYQSRIYSGDVGSTFEVGGCVYIFLLPPYCRMLHFVLSKFEISFSF